MRFANRNIVFGLIAASVAVAGLKAQTDAVRQPLARIGQQAIYEEDLLPWAGGQLLQLKNQEYEVRSKALENVVNQRLLESEAKSKGLSVDALLEQNAYGNLSHPTTAEVEAYYLGQKDRINRPFNDVRPQLEEALTQLRRQQARQGYVDQLRGKSGVAILLSRPKIEVAADPARLRGNPDAPVTIVEFSDFQCPFCQAAEATLKQVLDKYKGKVRLAYRDFPLTQIHPNAEQAAEASRCAGEQGKFWEYHDLLYANQAKLDQNGLTEHARSAALDVEKFSGCLASGKFKVPVASDLQTGSMSGISGTPAFYINGVPLSGAQPASEFEKIIESELVSLQSKKTGQQGSGPNL